MRTMAVVLMGALLVPSLRGGPALRRLSSSGTVWINAAPLPSGSLVYPGDTVATGDNGRALVTSTGHRRIEIRPNSLISLGLDEVELRGGVIGSDRMAVRLGRYRIAPAGAEPPSGHWFVVAQRGAKTLLAAYRGDLVIYGAENTAPLVVREGFYAVPSTDGSEDDNPEGNDKPGAGQDPAWTIGSLSRKANLALAASLGALAAAGTLVGIELLEEPVSPSR